MAAVKNVSNETGDLGWAIIYVILVYVFYVSQGGYTIICTNSSEVLQLRERNSYLFLIYVSQSHLMYPINVNTLLSD